MARLVFTLLLLTTLVLSSCARPINLEQARYLTFQLTRALKRSSSYRTIGKLIEQTGLIFRIARYVQKGEGFTILAPTDAAFAAANLTNPLNLPCKENTNTAVTNNYLRTTVALHLIATRLRAVEFDQSNIGAEFFTGTAVSLRKINNTLDEGQWLGVLDAFTATFNSVAQIKKGDVIRRTSRFAVHGISGLLSYPFQWEGV